MVLLSEEQAAATLAPYLLNGAGLDPGLIDLSTFPDDWRMVALALQTGATPDAILTALTPTQLQAITKADPDADPQALLDIQLSQRWQVLDAGFLMAPAAPPVYLIDSMIRRPSVVCVYGAPGDLKSFLLMDLAVCIASGQPWLDPLPKTGTGGHYRLTQGPVVWFDQDNGKERLRERFGALCRARNISDPALPLRAISLPSPPYTIGHPEERDLLIAQIQQLRAVACVLDNLGTISGGVDENSSDMVAPMANLRYVAEATGAAIFVIHHSRKGGSNGGREGDRLRGHSSIEASLDLALIVERERDTVKVQSTKTRDDPVRPFEALWTYEANAQKALETGRFWHLRDVESKLYEYERIGKELGDMLINMTPPINQGALRKEIRNTYDVSDATARKAIDFATQEGLIVGVKQGDQSNSPMLYHVPGPLDKAASVQKRF